MKGKLRRKLGLAGQAVAVAILVAFLPASLAQTSDASVQGTVTDADGRPLPGARVTARHLERGSEQSTETDARGRYSLTFLPRGFYEFNAERDGFWGPQRRGIELPVGARAEVNLTLFPAAGAEKAGLSEILGSIPPAPGLGAETIAASVSVVVEESKILQLPLATRNVYSLFLLQPGVTSHGATVRRGLSFSAHGQRVSGSNYQLDGVDNNNIIVTGPVAVPSAEAIQEFRMVQSSFSSDTGRATSFVAQVATRTGANRFHGGLFEFLANDKLNANTFQNNTEGVDKTSVRHNQFGYSASGPLARNKSFASSVLELSRLRYGTWFRDRVPSGTFIAGLREDSTAGRLLREVPPVPSQPLVRDARVGLAAYPVSNRIDTLLATERWDHHFANARDRLLARYTLAATTEQRSEEGEFAGYPTLRPTDRFRSHNSLLAWTRTFYAGPTNDLRVGWNRERITRPRPYPQIPQIVTMDGVLLPGSKRLMDQRENNNVIQVSENFSMRRGRSTFLMGFDYRRNLSNGITLGLEREALGGTGVFFDGFYLFPDLEALRREQPAALSISVDRFSSAPLRRPDLSRKYRSGDYAFFFQDDLKISRRFSLNVGLRYEYFGVPHNTDRSRDVNFYFGPGEAIQERLTSGNLRSTDQNPGELQGMLYRRDRQNWAPSVGAAWDPWGKGRTVVRAGYAVALDRVFETVRDLRMNTQRRVNCVPPFCRPRLLIPAEQMLPELPQGLLPADVVHLDENLRTPYAQNWYAGVQHNMTSNLVVEIGHAGSVGRKLISRDEINRAVLGVPRLNPRVGTDTFLSNAGNSNYLALEAGFRQRYSRGLQWQASYTYSHAIDNQSDILEGVRTGPDRFDLALARFTREFDARVDRGSANFDQRQNLVCNVIWDLPFPRGGGRTRRLLAGWAISGIAGYRSGFPVTVISSLADVAAGLRNNRPDYLGGESTATGAEGRPVSGGVQWMDAALFRPAPDRVGSLGRGAIPGPGFWNYDLAILRNFGSTERRWRAQFRTEFYNAFNHANLSAPVSELRRPDFGRAYYGRNRTFSRFGELPLENSARRIQFGLRLQF